MTDKKWVRRNFDPDASLRISTELNLPREIGMLLSARGISTTEEAKIFLSPSLRDLPDPFLFREMEKAVKRVARAIVNEEKIAIHGDYDVDGITSTALLYLFLKEVGARNVSYILPNRITDTYGLSMEAVKVLYEKGVTVLITVDCGSSSYREVEFAQSHGMDVIITDHHQIGDRVPPAFALLNPNRKGCSFPSRELAGVGVAYYFVIGLRSYLRRTGFFRRREEPNLKKYLDLVALGTIADIVPLTGANRIFVKKGLEVLEDTKRPGLVALKKVAGIENSRITPYTVGFIIAPRLNASARLGDTELPFRLLISENLEEGIVIARELEKRNRERQELERLIEKEALEHYSSSGDAEGRKTLVLYNPEWHPGIIGLVASRLAERFRKPTFILGNKGDVTVGSGRSLPGIHLFSVLKEMEDLFISYGGHSMAAGLTIEEEKIPLLIERIEEVVSRIGRDLEIVETYDFDLQPSRLSMELMEGINLLQPYGEGNPEPLFRARNLTVQKRYMTSTGNHLKLILEDEDGKRFSAIAFRWKGDTPPEESKVEIIYTPHINTYNGFKEIELHIADILR